jgi:hypothetical protein
VTFAILRPFALQWVVQPFRFQGCVS